MSSVKITIDISDRPIEDALARLLAAAGDLKPVLKNIGVMAADSTLERIRAEKSPDGTPFAPLNPLYAETKKGPGILRGQSGNQGGLSEIVWQLAGDSAVEIGSNTPYSRIHQLGGVIKAKNAPALFFSMGGQSFTVKSVTMPARPYLGISAEDEAEIIAIVKDHFEEALGKAP